MISLVPHWPLFWLVVHAMMAGAAIATLVLGGVPPARRDVLALCLFVLGGLMVWECLLVQDALGR